MSQKQLYTRHVNNLSFSDWHKTRWTINCQFLCIHSILPHRLLLWRMVLLFRLTEAFKVGSDGRQLNSHVGYYIKCVTIFRFCCPITWKSSFAQINCGKRKKFEHCIFRQQIFRCSVLFCSNLFSSLLFSSVLFCFVLDGQTWRS